MLVGLSVCSSQRSATRSVRFLFRTWRAGTCKTYFPSPHSTFSMCGKGRMQQVTTESMPWLLTFHMYLVHDGTTSCLPGVRMHTNPTTYGRFCDGKNDKNSKNNQKYSKMKGLRCSANGTRPVKCTFRFSFSHFRRSPRRPYARARARAG